METTERSLEVSPRPRGEAAPYADVGHGPHRLQTVRLLVLSDALSLALAALFALFLREDASTRDMLLQVPVPMVLAGLTFVFYGLYERDRQQIAVSTLDEWRDFLNALSVVCLIEIVAVQAYPGFGHVIPPSTSTIATYWLAALVVLPVGRAIIRHRVFPLIHAEQKTLIVGAGHVGQRLALKIMKHNEYNTRLVGFLDDEPHDLDPELANVPVLGGEDDLVEVIRAYGVSRVILAFSRRSAERLLEVVRGAGLRDVHLSIVPRYFEIIASSVQIVDVEGIPLIEVPAARLSRTARVSKRAFDLVLTSLGLILLAPMFLVIALWIKLDSRGPVFFRQRRMGRDQKPFDIIKFRTMHVGAEQRRSDLIEHNESTGPLFKIREDPRVTRVGAWLRKLSLDELPQLINVLRGEMSLVGPRPFVVYEDDKIVGWARRRLDLTPGITGLWQVLGRNDIEFEEMVRLDYLYVNSWSLWWDVKLLLRTAPIVFSRRGY
jgi:exopolysaccharide biosynthesis polyprenyl glycosylphosphotransferase